MKEYTVTLAVLWGTTIEADNAEDALAMALSECEYDPEISVPAQVWCDETGEEKEIPFY